MSPSGPPVTLYWIFTVAPGRSGWSAASSTNSSSHSCDRCFGIGDPLCAGHGPARLVCAVLQQFEISPQRRRASRHRKAPPLPEAEQLTGRRLLVVVAGQRHVGTFGHVDIAAGVDGEAVDAGEPVVVEAPATRPRPADLDTAGVEDLDSAAEVRGVALVADRRALADEDVPAAVGPAHRPDGLRVVVVPLLQRLAVEREHL